MELVRLQRAGELQFLNELSNGKFSALQGIADVHLINYSNPANKRLIPDPEAFREGVVAAMRNAWVPFISGDEVPEVPDFETELKQGSTAVIFAVEPGTPIMCALEKDAIRAMVLVQSYEKNYMIYHVHSTFKSKGVSKQIVIATAALIHHERGIRMLVYPSKQTLGFYIKCHFNCSDNCGLRCDFECLKQTELCTILRYTSRRCASQRCAGVFPP